LSIEFKILCKINLLTQRKNSASNLAIYYQEQINDLEKELKEINKTQEVLSDFTLPDIRLKSNANEFSKNNEEKVYRSCLNRE
jgi:Rad3-related DNA helicase